MIKDFIIQMGEKHRGNQIVEAIENNNASKLHYLLGKNKTFDIESPVDCFNKVMVITRSANLGLIYLDNIKRKFQPDQKALNTSVNLPHADELIKKVIREMSVGKSSEEINIRLSMALRHCYDPVYLYFLVEKGADIHYKQERKETKKTKAPISINSLMNAIKSSGEEEVSYTESLIIHLSEEFVSRDIKDRFDKITKNQNFYQGYDYIQSMMKVAFELGANPNDFYTDPYSKKNVGIFEIIANGYNKPIGKSLIQIHKQQYKDIFYILAQNNVPMRDVIKDPVLNQKLKEVYCEIEKEKIMENINKSDELSSYSGVVRKKRL